LKVAYELGHLKCI